jgi:hypothetical protein
MTPTTEVPVDYFLTLSGNINGVDMPMKCIAALRSGAFPSVRTLYSVSISGNYTDSAYVLQAQLVQLFVHELFTKPISSVGEPSHHWTAGCGRPAAVLNHLIPNDRAN